MPARLRIPHPHHPTLETQEHQRIFRNWMEIEKALNDLVIGTTAVWWDAIIPDDYANVTAAVAALQPTKPRIVLIVRPGITTSETTLTITSNLVVICPNWAVNYNTSPLSLGADVVVGSGQVWTIQASLSLVGVRLAPAGLGAAINGVATSLISVIGGQLTLNTAESVSGVGSTLILRRVDIVRAVDCRLSPPAGSAFTAMDIECANCLLPTSFTFRNVNDAVISGGRFVAVGCAVPPNFTITGSYGRSAAFGGGLGVYYNSVSLVGCTPELHIAAIGTITFINVAQIVIDGYVTQAGFNVDRSSTGGRAAHVVDCQVTVDRDANEPTGNNPIPPRPSINIADSQLGGLRIQQGLNNYFYDRVMVDGNNFLINDRILPASFRAHVEIAARQAAQVIDNILDMGSAAGSPILIDMAPGGRSIRFDGAGQDRNLIYPYTGALQLEVPAPGRADASAPAPAVTVV